VAGIDGGLNLYPGYPVIEVKELAHHFRHFSVLIYIRMNLDEVQEPILEEELYISGSKAFPIYDMTSGLTSYPVTEHFQFILTFV
jgi:hypothetical protein